MLVVRSPSGGGTCLGTRPVRVRDVCSVGLNSGGTPDAMCVRDTEFAEREQKQTTLWDVPQIETNNA